MSRLVVIGNDGFAIRCMRIMLEHPGISIELILTDAGRPGPGGSVERFAETQSIPVLPVGNINAGPVVSAVADAEPDYVFTLLSLKIIKAPMLALPKVATVNWHNAPLPRYGGVHPQCWAIYNGETEFGVTWHYVDEGIDTGRIIAQRMFPLDPRETAMILLRKSIDHGVEQLREMFPRLLRGEIEPQTQDHAQASYYSRKDVPNEGRIDFNWPYEQFDRFLRALDFAPFENTLAYPKAMCGEQAFYITHAKKSDRAADGSACGEVFAIEDDAMHVRIGDGAVRVDQALSMDLQPVPVGELAASLGIGEGDRLR